MIYRIFPEKDNFITNYVKDGVPKTGSNFGESEILELFKKAGLSGASGYYSSSSLSRILIQFDLSAISSLTASSEFPSTGSLYYLKLFNARHTKTIPVDYYIEAVPMSSSWTEGVGIDNDEYLDDGCSNWIKSSNSTYWTSQGGDFLNSVTSSFRVIKGYEDVEIDITRMVNAWLTGGLENNGLMLKLTTSEENDSSDYFVKKFHGKNTHYLDKRPTLEVRFDDSIKDDRGSFVFGLTNNLYLYNKKRGQLQDISGIGTGQNVLTVKISDLSGTLTTVSASHTGLTGIYSASISMASGSYSGSLFSDKWSFGGVSYMTGTFVPGGDNPQESNVQNSYQVKIMNIKPQYSTSEKVRFNLFVKTNNYNPSVYNTGSLVLQNTIINKAYYKIENALTNQTIINIGTGSLETTRLSYDENGNYFNFHMNNLSPNEVYKIIFFVDSDGQFQRINNEFRFKVV